MIDFRMLMFVAKGRFGECSCGCRSFRRSKIFRRIVYCTRCGSPKRPFRKNPES